jgi:hypothetical protein
VTKIISVIFVNFAIPIAGAKHELVFSKSLLNKSSCLAAALDVTKFTTARDLILATLLSYLSQT